MFTLLFLFFVSLFLVAYLVRKKNVNEAGLGHIPGPPTSNFLLGNSAELRDPVKRVEIIGRWYKEYGPVFKLTGGVFTSSEVILVDPDIEPSVMRIADKGNGFWPFKWFMRFIAKTQAIFILDGDLWSTRRKEVMHQGFMFKDLQDNFRVVDENLAKITKLLMDPSRGPTDIHQLASMVLVDSMSQSLFGTPLGVIDDPTHAYMSCFEGIVKEMAIVQNFPLHFFHPRTLKIMMKVKNLVLALSQEHIGARLAHPEKFKDKEDVCSRLVNRGCIDHEAAAAELNAALIASSGNPSLSIVWLLFTLVKLPHIKERVESELAEVLGEKDRPEYDDLKSMRYLDLVVQETFRMFIPDAIHRKTDVDMELHGFHIPKDTQIWIPSFLSHFEKVGPDPYTFNPDRFENPDRPIRIHPFGGGPRICLGHMWTKMTVKMVVANIIHNFHVSLDPNNPPVVPEFHMLLFESARIKFIFRPKEIEE